MSTLGKRLIKAAREAVTLHCEADPQSYRVHVLRAPGRHLKNLLAETTTGCHRDARGSRRENARPSQSRVR